MFVFTWPSNLERYMVEVIDIYLISYSTISLSLYLTTATVWTYNVLCVHEEASSHHTGLTFIAVEAITVPVALLKGNELSAANTCNRLSATTASFGKQFPIAVSTIRLLIFGGKLLPSQLFVAVCAGETLTMERGILVTDTSLVDHISTFGTSLGIVTLIARHTHHALFTGDKTLVSDWLSTFTAGEALVMPLVTLVFKFLHSSTERLPTSITAGSELVVMAVRTVDLLFFGRERLLD